MFFWGVFGDIVRQVLFFVVSAVGLITCPWNDWTVMVGIADRQTDRPAEKTGRHLSVWENAKATEFSYFTSFPELHRMKQRSVEVESGCRLRGTLGPGHPLKHFSGWQWWINCISIMLGIDGLCLVYATFQELRLVTTVGIDPGTWVQGHYAFRPPIRPLCFVEHILYRSTHLDTRLKNLFEMFVGTWGALRG